MSGGRWGGGPIAEGLALGGLLVAFGQCVRERPSGSPVLAGLALLLAGLLLLRIVWHPDGLESGLGVWTQPRRWLAWLGGGVLAGVLLAVAWRTRSASWPILPLRLTAFAAVAALIGGTEEIIFRGFLQGRLQAWSPALAVTLAATFHTAYKLSLFLPPTPGESVNLGFLTLGTMLGGVAFGVARQYSGSVWPCVVAHAAFDVVGYGDAVVAPAWVWS